MTYVAGANIRQFIDVGCGLPTPPNTHQTALSSLCGGRRWCGWTTMSRSSLTPRMSWPQPKTSIRLPVTSTIRTRSSTTGASGRMVNFYQPLCLVLTMALHFYDTEAARRITARFIDAIPYGSYLVCSVGQLEGEAGPQFSRQYSAGRLFHHNRDDVTSFLDGLELVHPGVTEARTWRAPMFAPLNGRRGHIWAAVGRKAGRVG